MQLSGSFACSLSLASRGSPSLDLDPLPWESYDICQSAASQVASFGECIRGFVCAKSRVIMFSLGRTACLYHEKYNMRWAPPFLANCLQAAGVMSIVVCKSPMALIETGVFR